MKYTLTFEEWKESISSNLKKYGFKDDFIRQKIIRYLGLYENRNKFTCPDKIVADILNSPKNLCELSDKDYEKYQKVRAKEKKDLSAYNKVVQKRKSVLTEKLHIRFTEEKGVFPLFTRKFFSTRGSTRIEWSVIKEGEEIKDYYQVRVGTKYIAAKDCVELLRILKRLAAEAA
ncbi:hypothetical protein M2146_001124 [Lachnospiraceae bacterium PF1-22]